MIVLRGYQQYALDKLLETIKRQPLPVLVKASVGAGKTIIISKFLEVMEKKNWRSLCLTMNSTLIEQNAQTYADEGHSPGIYCSGLKQNNHTANVIFASPHSIVQAIKHKAPIASVKFNLIVVDEAHNINPHNKSSMYMRILNHFGLMAQSEQYSYRIVGLTGTPYRGNGISIVDTESANLPLKDRKALFVEEVCSISASWLIAKDYLVRPIFGKTHVESLDMKNIRVDKMGKFKNKHLQEVVDRSKRLTAEIIKEVVSVVQNGRNGAFIFASTIQHAHECMQGLPPEQSACITGKTSHEDRKAILKKAKEGEIKYLVNVATLLVGVDVPNFDVCAWLRPTESLTLYIQGIGRVLRLSPGKKDAVVLDYAGNVDRHGDLDDDIICEAQKPKDEEDEKEYNIICSDCNTRNKDTSRRCIGMHNRKRCEHYFEYKNCKNKVKDEEGKITVCGVKNDITARHCRKCEQELIDPNKKLKKERVSDAVLLKVLEAKYWVTQSKGYDNHDIAVVNIKYNTNKGEVFESYYINNEKSKNIFYGRFVKYHVDNSSDFYPKLMQVDAVKDLIYRTPIKTPVELICNPDKYERFVLVRKIF